MRAAPWLFLLSLAGCSSWTGVAAARRDVLAEALEAERFPLRVADVSARPPSGLALTCEALPGGESACRACGESGCARLVDDVGGLHVQDTGTLSEREVSALWVNLGPGLYADVRAALPELVPAMLVEQQRRFEPRWGFTGGVAVSAVTDGTPIGLGARAGVRRWFDVHLAGFALLQYLWRADHDLHLRFGLEVARFTPGRFWGNLGAPPASIALFAGPVLRLPFVRAGVRTGLTFLVTELRSAPFFIELSMDTYFAGEASRLAGNFSVGFGI